MTNQTLPVHAEIGGAKIESTEKLIQHMAVEVARVLHTYAPIVIAFVGPQDGPDDFRCEDIPELERTWETAFRQRMAEAVARTDRFL